MTIILALILASPVIFLAGCSILSPNPPKPKYQYGEFPFSLTYEINGERVEIKDTLVIEYTGTGYNEGLGKYNKWNTYYKSSQTSDNTLEIFNDYVEGIGSVIIFYELGSCEYYMGLVETEELFISKTIKPGDIVISSPKGTGPITDEDLYEYFGIRIVEKLISPPMIN